MTFTDDPARDYESFCARREDEVIPCKPGCTRGDAEHAVCSVPVGNPPAGGNESLDVFDAIEDEAFCVWETEVNADLRWDFEAEAKEYDTRVEVAYQGWQGWRSGSDGDPLPEGASEEFAEGWRDGREHRENAEQEREASVPDEARALVSEWEALAQKLFALFEKGEKESPRARECQARMREIEVVLGVQEEEPVRHEELYREDLEEPLE